MPSHKPDPTVYPEDIQCIVDSVDGKGGIFISNVQAAQNSLTLKKHGIKAVLTAAASINLSHTKNDVPLYKKVPGEDHQKFDLSKYFDESVNFIENSLKTTNILVHCMAGVSRSVSLVLAYFIKVKGMTYQQSYSLVKSKRKIIYPNDGFISQLKNYQKQCNKGNQRKSVGVYQSSKRSTLKVSEQFKNILSKYDSPSKAFTSTTPTKYESQTSKYFTNSYYSNMYDSPTKANIKSDLYSSPMRRTTHDYSPLKQYNAQQMSPRKTYGEDYKSSINKKQYQNSDQLEKRIQSIRKKYSNKISDFASHNHQRNKSYVENQRLSITQKISQNPEPRNSPSKLLLKKTSLYNHY